MSSVLTQVLLGLGIDIAWCCIIAILMALVTCSNDLLRVNIVCELCFGLVMTDGFTTRFVI